MANNLLLINQSTGHLTVDVVNKFVASGCYDQVVLMAGHVGKTERPLHKSVRLSKIISYNRTSSIKRVFTWGWGTFQILCRLLTKYRNYKVVYVTNPPMSYLCSRLAKNPFSVIVYDIYPDALRNIGIREGNVIFSWWAKQNKKLFAKAERVYTLSESMASALTAYMPKEKITVTPLWPMSEAFRPIPKYENPFAVKHHLQDKFVVMYSGNMGNTHSVDVLVEIASRLKNNDKIHFLLVGGGAKKKELAERIEREQLFNCTMLNWQPIEVLPHSLACADLGVVTLNEESAKVSVPSKTFNLMAVGAPILCLSPAESELSRLIETYKNGACFHPADLEGAMQFIIRLADDEAYRVQLSVNSLEASKHFTVKNTELYL